MATNHTTNYALNLWEPNDKFVREEFNENTSKIDEALACHPSAELICTSTADEETGSHFYLDISKVDWSRYLALILSVESSTLNGVRVGIGSTTEICSIYHGHTDLISSDNTLARNVHSSHMSMILPVLYNGEHRPTAISFGSSGYPNTSTEACASFSTGGGITPLKECKKFTVSCDTGKYAPGDWVVLWGIK